ncbi:MAG: hypothetical protein H6679_04770 [Epsilonproteobacteria bacterium]|nr:hypothetical protein [Campylobacterota bacterium]
MINKKNTFLFTLIALAHVTTLYPASLEQEIIDLFIKYVEPLSIDLMKLTQSKEAQQLLEERKKQREQEIKDLQRKQQQAQRSSGYRPSSSYYRPSSYSSSYSSPSSYSGSGRSRDYSSAGSYQDTGGGSSWQPSSFDKKSPSSKTMLPDQKDDTSKKKEDAEKKKNDEKGLLQDEQAKQRYMEALNAHKALIGALKQFIKDTSKQPAQQQPAKESLEKDTKLYSSLLKTKSLSKVNDAFVQRESSLRKLLEPEVKKLQTTPDWKNTFDSYKSALPKILDIVSYQPDQKLAEAELAEQKAGTMLLINIRDDLARSNREKEFAKFISDHDGKLTARYNQQAQPLIAKAKGKKKEDVEKLQALHDKLDVVLNRFPAQMQLEKLNTLKNNLAQSLPAPPTPQELAQSAHKELIDQIKKGTEAAKKSPENFLKNKYVAKLIQNFAVRDKFLQALDEESKTKLTGSAREWKAISQELQKLLPPLVICITTLSTGAAHGQEHQKAQSLMHKIQDELEQFGDEKYFEDALEVREKKILEEYQKEFNAIEGKLKAGGLTPDAGKKLGAQRLQLVEKYQQIIVILSQYGRQQPPFPASFSELLKHHEACRKIVPAPTP